MDNAESIFDGEGNLTQPATGATSAGGLSGDLPRNRMVVAVLSLIGVFLAAYLVANNLGLTPPIPCGQGDCGTVQSSQYAWVGPVPVSAIGLVGYAALFVLAMMGLQPRWAGSRAVAFLLLGGAALGVLFSAYLTYIEAVVLQAWCRYCVASAILIGLVLVAAVPEVKRVRGAVG